MAELEVTVNGKPYTIRCDDGQEAHVAGLAEMVSGKVRDLVKTVGQVGDARLLLMAGLLIADELSSARAQALDNSDAQPPLTQDATAVAEVLGRSIVAELDLLADRIEGIAASLEHA